MQTWGRYTVFSCIERTYLTEVYDAYLPISNDLVRRVHIRKPSDDAPEAPRALVQHARQAVQLTHSGIAPILELSYSGDVPLVVSMGVPGRSLSTLMARRTKDVGLDTHAVLFIAVQILEALAHTHQHADPAGRLVGLVHRDVRPQTIWIGFDGAVRLEGFGFSVDARMSPEPLPPLVAPLYWPPELAQGRPIDHRSDLFSVGAILFELLSGRPLWAGQTSQECWAHARQGQVPLLGDIAPHLPGELVRAVDGALSPAPDERPPSALLFRDELARLLYRSEPAYGSARLASAAAMVLGEDAAEDAARAAGAYEYLSHLEPGLVIQTRGDAEPVAPGGPPADSGAPRRAPPPPPEASEDLPVADSGPSSWSDTEAFHAQSYDGFDAFDPVATPQDADPVDRGPPTLADEASTGAIALPPSREATSAPPYTPQPSPIASPPPYTPPRIEAPDPAAAMADAFSEQSSDPSASAAPEAPPPRRAAPPKRRRPVAYVLLALIVLGAGGWLASSPAARRRVTKLVRVAVIGRKPGGTLILESIPSGARVVLDSEDTGQTTPVTIENLESELTHTLTLRLDDLVRTTTVSVRANRRRKMSIVFPEAVTTVRVESTPEEASVIVDGRSLAFTPADLTLRANQEATIRVTKTGYVPQAWTIIPKRGERLKLSHVFEKTEALKAAEAEDEALRKAQEAQSRRARRRRGR